MLEIKNLCAGYGGKTVINDINLSFAAGKVTGIIGPNGSGKSTLMKAIVNDAGVYDGSIFFCGEDITSISPGDRAKKIAYLPQSKAVPDMTVEHTVLSGRFPYLSYPRRYGRLDRKIADDALVSLGVENLRYEFVRNLSGGQRQMVYIAMALAQNTPVIMMDEPTSFLDISHQLRLCSVIRKLADMGKAVPVVMHDLSLAFSLCDMLYVMDGGKIVFEGSTDEALAENITKKIFGVGMKKISVGDTHHYVYV